MRTTIVFSYTHGQCPYDLIGDLDGKLLKVQAKTAKKKPAQRQAYRITAREYESSEVDLFAGYASDEDEVFYVPYKEAGSYCSVTFTPEEILTEHNAQQANLAKDHMLKAAISR